MMNPPPIRRAVAAWSLAVAIALPAMAQTATPAAPRSANQPAGPEAAPAYDRISDPVDTMAALAQDYGQLAQPVSPGYAAAHHAMIRQLVAGPPQPLRQAIVERLNDADRYPTILGADRMRFNMPEPLFWVAHAAYLSDFDVLAEPLLRRHDLYPGAHRYMVELMVLHHMVHADRVAAERWLVAAARNAEYPVALRVYAAIVLGNGWALVSATHADPPQEIEAWATQSPQPVFAGRLLRAMLTRDRIRAWSRQERQTQLRFIVDAQAALSLLHTAGVPKNALLGVHQQIAAPLRGTRFGTQWQDMVRPALYEDQSIEYRALERHLQRGAASASKLPDTLLRIAPPRAAQTPELIKAQLADLLKRTAAIAPEAASWRRMALAIYLQRLPLNQASQAFLLERLREGVMLQDQGPLAERLFVNHYKINKPDADATEHMLEWCTDNTLPPAVRLRLLALTLDQPRSALLFDRYHLPDQTPLQPVTDDRAARLATKSAQSFSLDSPLPVAYVGYGLLQDLRSLAGQLPDGKTRSNLLEVVQSKYPEQVRVSQPGP